MQMMVFTQTQGYLDFYMLINRNTYIPRYYRDRVGQEKGQQEKGRKSKKSISCYLLTSIVVLYRNLKVLVQRKEKNQQLQQTLIVDLRQILPGIVRYHITFVTFVVNYFHISRFIHTSKKVEETKTRPDSAMSFSSSATTSHSYSLSEAGMIFFHPLII